MGSKPVYREEASTLGRRRRPTPVRRIWLGAAGLTVLFYLVTGAVGLDAFTRFVDFLAAVSTEGADARKPTPVAVVDTARDEDPRCLPDQATGRTPSVCIIEVLDAAERDGARAVVLDYFFPVIEAGTDPETTLGEDDRRLAERLRRSKIPIVLLVQPGRNDGIERPFAPLPNIFDPIRSPHILRGTALLIADPSRRTRYAEAYRTSDGQIIPSVPFVIAALDRPSAPPARLLTGEGLVARHNTVPILRAGPASTLSDDPRAAIVITSPSVLRDAANAPALRDRVWLVGNTSRRSRDEHKEGDRVVSGLELMARAVSTAPEATAAPHLSHPAWTLLVLAIIPALVLLAMLLDRYAKGAWKAVFLVPLGFVVALALQFLLLRAFGLAAWQSEDIILESTALAALMTLLAEGAVFIHSRVWGTRR